MLFILLFIRTGEACPGQPGLKIHSKILNLSLKSDFNKRIFFFRIHHHPMLEAAAVIPLAVVAMDFRKVTQWTVLEATKVALVLLEARVASLHLR